MRGSWLFLVAACSHELAEEAPGSRAGEVVADCVVPLRGALAGHGAPASLEYDADGPSLWMWEDARAIVRSADAACRGEMDVLSGPIVPLLPGEIAENQARTDGRRIAVAPIGGFVAAGRGYLYYEKSLRGPGIFDAQHLGTGVCVVDAMTSACARTPDLLWTVGRPWGGSGLVAADGYAYVVSCLGIAAFTELCETARVRPEAAADASAYTFLGFDGSFGADPSNGAVVLDGTNLASPSFVPSLGAYVVVFPNIFAPSLEVARSDAPGGPFGSRTRLFPAIAPDTFFIGGGREHRALRRDDTVAITYDTRPSGLHLVTFRFAPEAWP
ncbi:MAG TPA: hypothetical protein VKE22_09975 [Haliangiales bacterium]|nr:hypothetical protein [Haliangiales bacterium]